MYYKRNVPKEFQPNRGNVMQKEREVKQGTEERSEQNMKDCDNDKIVASENCEVESVQEKVDECLEDGCEKSCENKCEKEEEKMFSRENFKRDKRPESSFLPILIILLLIR